jgi:hypothetical protein
VKQAHEELQRQLSALRSRFTDTGRRAAAAAEALTDTIVPEAELIDALAETGRAFVKLRGSLLEQATALSPMPDVTSLTSLAHLESVLRAAIEAEERYSYQAAWEHARETALATLDRVMRLIHREDAAFPPLVACHAQAREMHLFISSQQPDNPEQEITIVNGRVRAFAELATLVDGWDVLDDDRCVFLQDAITQSFGRPLALAALRGKLGNQGDVIAPAPEPVWQRVAPQPPAARVPEPPPPPVARAPAEERVSFAAAAAAPEPAVAEPAHPAPRAPEPAVTAGTSLPPGGKAFVIERPPMPAMRSGDVPRTLPPSPSATRPPAQPVVASALSSPVAQIRLAGDKVQVETSAEQRVRETSLEAMAAQTAQWWVAARKGWNEFRAGGASFGDAAKDMLKRHPYLLSVPIQKSAEHEGGRLAEGYALLLEHVEKQEEGFVKEALTRLNPQFTAGGKDQTFQLGQELYLYVVAEGRLYKTYPDFIKEIMSRAVPEPGFWVQGGLTERPEDTATFTRVDAAGTQALTLASVTGDKQRAAPHLFAVTLGALTTRFFKVEAGELTDPPDVEIKLKEHDSASDRAWIVTVPVTGTPEAPKKHKAGGTVIPELGKQHRLVWIGVFNSDPNHDKTYELAITLKRKPRAAAPAAATFVPPKPSPFAPRKQ